jgi:hypothetical protein
MCFSILAEKCKDIKKWIRGKLGIKKIVPKPNSFAQILAEARRVPDKVFIPTAGDFSLGKIKSQNKVPKSSDHK